MLEVDREVAFLDGGNPRDEVEGFVEGEGVVPRLVRTQAEELSDEEAQNPAEPP